jgi:hypothetical protein
MSGSMDQSVPSAGKRSYRPSAKVNSMVTFCPSVNPFSLRPRRNSAIGRADCPRLNELRNPITGALGCCVRAATGHSPTAAPSTLKSRRLT